MIIELELDNKDAFPKGGHSFFFALKGLCIPAQGIALGNSL